PTVVGALREHRKRLMADGLLGSPLVFPSAEGTPLRRSNVTRRSFLPLLQRAGLPRIRFHDLRHTFASTMLTQGVHPKVVSEMLGHAHVGITLSIYSHIMPTMQKEAAVRLDAVLFGSG
ncbi:MAG: tyrosine-type recombinase/integrase, partial [Candidatus Eremiobacteraeota bacterium]|nr:tyrosine-type recombinase/integrase [Candidatus Eremiobacteraeota bacterium]